MLIIAAALSFLFCAAASFIWIRSHWVEDYAYKGRPGTSLAVLSSSHGSLWIGTENGWPSSGTWSVMSQTVGSASAYSPAFGVKHVDSDGSLPGIQIIHASGWLSLPQDRAMVSSNSPSHIVCVTIGWGWLAIPTAILPAIVILRSGAKRLRIRRRRGAHLCISCGYDLRATPERCPECGATPEDEADTAHLVQSLCGAFVSAICGRVTSVARKHFDAVRSRQVKFNSRSDRRGLAVGSLFDLGKLVSRHMAVTCISFA